MGTPYASSLYYRNHPDSLPVPDKSKREEKGISERNQYLMCYNHQFTISCFLQIISFTTTLCQLLYWTERNKFILFFTGTHSHSLISILYNFWLSNSMWIHLLLQRNNVCRFSFGNINIRFLRTHCHWPVLFKFGSQFHILICKEMEGPKRHTGQWTTASWLDEFVTRWQSWVLSFLRWRAVFRRRAITFLCYEVKSKVKSKNSGFF